MRVSPTSVRREKTALHTADVSNSKWITAHSKKKKKTLPWFFGQWIIELWKDSHISPLWSSSWLWVSQQLQHYTTGVEEGAPEPNKPITPLARPWHSTASSPRRHRCHIAWHYCGSVDPGLMSHEARHVWGLLSPHTAREIVLHTIKCWFSFIKEAVLLKQRPAPVSTHSTVEACDSYLIAVSVKAAGLGCFLPHDSPSELGQPPGRESI